MRVEYEINSCYCIFPKSKVLPTEKGRNLKHIPSNSKSLYFGKDKRWYKLGEIRFHEKCVKWDKIFSWRRLANVYLCTSLQWMCALTLNRWFTPEWMQLALFVLLNECNWHSLYLNTQKLAENIYIYERIKWKRLNRQALRMISFLCSHKGSHELKLFIGLRSYW